MPSPAPYLGLCLLALLPLVSLGLYSGDTDFYETSGGELQNEAHAPYHKWLSIAKQLRRDTESLREEQFERDFGDRSNMSEFDSLRMKTPLLLSSDGCLLPDFGELKCLRQIYTGLRVYRDYLPHVERENLTAAHMLDIKVGITRVLNLIKDTGKVNDDKAQPTPLIEVPKDSAWTQKIVVHSILYNFTNFLTDTCRAINYMKTVKGRKHNANEYTWPSKHKQ